jgi:hypothetical protein
MSLQRELDAFKAAFESGGPPYNVSRERIEIMHRATEELRRSGLAERALKVVIWRRRSSSTTRMDSSCAPSTCWLKVHW